MEGKGQKAKQTSQWPKHTCSLRLILHVEAPENSFSRKSNQNLTLLGQILSSFWCKHNPHYLPTFFSSLSKTLDFPYAPVLHQKGKGRAVSIRHALLLSKEIEIFFRFVSNCINSWACSILLYSALISIMTPKFTASHSGSLEENGSQIFFFLAFILIQNESILNTEPCGNGEEIQTLSPQVGDFIRISISEPTANSFLCCCGIPGCGTFPRYPS